MGNRLARVLGFAGSVFLASCVILGQPLVTFAETRTATVQVLIVIPERHISMKDRLEHMARAAELQREKRATAMEQALAAYSRTRLASAAIDTAGSSE